MERELICIVCPKGCTLKVKAATSSEVTPSDVTGHQCKRGVQYAVNECTHPVRTLTTTMRLSAGTQPLVPVKSAKPVPKELLLQCMALINTHTVKAPLKVGDVTVANILGLGIDIVSTANIDAEDPNGRTIHHRT